MITDYNYIFYIMIIYFCPGMYSIINSIHVKPTPFNSVCFLYSTARVRFTNHAPLSRNFFENLKKLQILRSDAIKHSKFNGAGEICISSYSF